MSQSSSFYVGDWGTMLLGIVGIFAWMFVAVGAAAVVTYGLLGLESSCGVTTATTGTMCLHPAYVTLAAVFLIAPAIAHDLLKSRRGGEQQ